MDVKAPPEGELAIEQEIRREMAGALKRLGERLQAHLDELGELGRQLSARPGAAPQSAVTRYQALRRQVEHERWVMKVQREAMGLRHHQAVDEHYPMPPKWQGAG